VAPRSHWNGYLKLSLVSCPIALYPAISAAERVSFRQVNRQTGNRLKQQLVDSVTGEVVQSDDKGRGYQIGENQLLLVEDEELEAARHEARARPYSAAPISRMLPPSDIPERTAAPEARPNKMERHRPKLDEADAAYEPMPVPVRVVNNRTIEVERCVPRAQIDPRYFDTPYYIAPRDEVGIEAFAVIRDAMRSKELVGMGHVVLAKRERPIIIEPMDNGLCGMTLRYTHEVRSAAEYFAGIPSLELPEEMLRVAEHILESKTTDFDPALLEDRYRTVLVSMLKEKQAELPKKPAKTMPPRQNVINLMDALKRSLVTERPIAKPKSRRKTSPSKSSGRK
jgi:DNA end-binding protein Ku